MPNYLADAAASRPMAFLSELATNASQHHVGVVIYSGNDDALVSHFSSEGMLVVLLSCSIALIKRCGIVVIQVCTESER